MNLSFFKKNRLIAITVIIFIVLITFVDKNNLMDGWQIRSNISALEEQKQFYLDRIREDSTVLENLKDDKYIEKFARERYYMKSPGEVVYVIK